MFKYAVFIALVLTVGAIFGWQHLFGPSPEQAQQTQEAPEAERKPPAIPDDQTPTNDAEKGGCAPSFGALFDHARVEIQGSGELNILVLTDPLCWHCRLGHKLLSEYPDKYKSYKLSFFPRQNFIGSDMAAWVLEDAAGTDSLKAKVDFAYDGLKQPKTSDLAEARALILVQFVTEFPDMLAGTTLDVLYARLQKAHEVHVLEAARLAKAANLPGTPVLVAGKNVLVGYGPAEWLNALDKKAVCP